MTASLTRYSPYMLSVLRIVVALVFMEHGTQKLFGSPPSDRASPELLSFMWFGGLLLALGLFARPVAFVVAGEMAVAYWMFHAPEAFYPILNGGDAAILYCFVFLYLVFAGPGPWSLDAMIARRSTS